ncbi:MAG: hypothetical protein ACLR70_02060 [Streptococcus thermophilus]
MALRPSVLSSRRTLQKGHGTLESVPEHPGSESACTPPVTIGETL